MENATSERAERNFSRTFKSSFHAWDGAPKSYASDILFRGIETGNEIKVACRLLEIQNIDLYEFGVNGNNRVSPFFLGAPVLSGPFSFLFSFRLLYLCRSEAGRKNSKPPKPSGLLPSMIETGASQTQLSCRLNGFVCFCPATCSDGFVSASSPGVLADFLACE